MVATFVKTSSVALTKEFVEATRRRAVPESPLPQVPLAAATQRQRGHREETCVRTRLSNRPCDFCTSWRKGGDKRFVCLTWPASRTRAPAAAPAAAPRPRGSAPNKRAVMSKELHEIDTNPRRHSLNSDKRLRQKTPWKLAYPGVGSVALDDSVLSAGADRVASREQGAAGRAANRRHAARQMAVGSC